MSLELTTATEQQLSGIRQALKTVSLIGDETISGVKNFHSRPTINNTGVLLSGDIPYVQTNSYFYVDPTRTDSYEQNGNILYPYKTLNSAYNAAKNIASFNNPTYITLLSPIAENLTIDKGYINLVGNNTNKNDPIRITGSLVFAATGIGSTITDNNFSIAGLGITATSNNKCILFSGNNPQRLFIQDCWLIAKDNGTCLYSNNTNTTSRLQGDILKLSPEGVNTTAIDIVSGTSSISFAETSSSASVLAYVRNNSTLNISNSQIETAGVKAFQVENAGRLTLLNSVLTNTANPSTGIFLKDESSTAVVVGSAISVPANANSYAINGVANSYLFYKNLYFSIDAIGGSTESKIGNNINKNLINSYEPNSIEEKLKNIVYATGNQTISGNKTFEDNINISGDLTLNGGFYINDIQELNLTGANIYADNLVYNTGNQTISGDKTFKTGSFDLLTINGQTDEGGDYSARINFVDSNWGSIDVLQDGNFKLRSSAGFFNIDTSAGQINTANGCIYELGQTLYVYKGYDNANINWFNKSIAFSDSLDDEAINYSNTIYHFKSGVIGYIPIDSEVVHKTGDETISGTKTFYSPIYFSGAENAGNGGYIDLRPGAKDQYAGGNAGSINLRGGDGTLDAPGGAGGSISLRGGTPNDSLGAGSGGSITADGSAGGGASAGPVNAGSLNMSAGDYLGAAGGSINTSSFGGSIITRGYINRDTPNYDLYSGGSINTSASNGLPGGSINTSNGGGSINTFGATYSGGNIDLSNNNAANFSIQTGNPPIQNDGSIYNKINDSLYLRKNSIWEKINTDKTNLIQDNLLFYSQPSGFFSGVGITGSGDGGFFLGRNKISQNTLLLKDENIGNSFSTKLIDSTRNWRGIAMSSDGKYQTAVVFAEAIYISNDYGNTWRAKASSQDWVDVSMSSCGKYQTAITNTSVSSNSKIYTSSDYGNTWTLITSSTYCQKVKISSDGKYQIITRYINSSEYIFSSNYGNTWTLYNNIISGSGVTAVAISSDGKYITIGGGTPSDVIYISSNYGNTWTNVGPSGIGFKEIAMSSDGKYQIAAPAYSPFSTPSKYIYVSSDYGNTWNFKISGGQRDWRCVDISSDGKYIIAATSGNIYISFNYGETWKSIGSSKTWSSVKIASNAKYIAAAADADYVYISKTDERIDGNLYVDNLYASGNLTVNNTGVLLSGQNSFVINFQHAAWSSANNTNVYFSNINFSSFTPNTVADRRKIKIMQPCTAKYASWAHFTTTKPTSAMGSTGYFVNITSGISGIINTSIYNNTSSILDVYSGEINPPVPVRFGDEVTCGWNVPNWGAPTNAINSVEVYFFN